VLNTYTSQAVTEGAQTAKTLACFDANTGFLQRTRTLAGAAAGGDDLVTINTADVTGNVKTQHFFGGDNAGLSTSALCTASFGSPSYEMRNTYVAGTRATSQYFDGGTAMSFLSLDNSVDASTGLVSTTRDSSGFFPATFTYDTSGRLKTFTPSGASFAASYSFWPATTMSKARAEVAQQSSTSGSLQSQTTFDDFGRVEQEDQLMPNGSWSSRVTKYDDLGNKADVSELESGTPSHFTTFRNYDQFGRVGTIQLPDGKQTTMSYTGVRSTARTVLVGTALVQTQEVYDRQGRLQQVIEPNGTITDYTYDVGNRLRTVSMGAQPQRVFDYDLRGFLHQETHPENGTVTYRSYDARGHAGEKALAALSRFDQRFTYDAAERLRQVTARNPDALSVFRTMKTLTFGSSGTENGKLLTAVRHNYQPFGDITVTDTYTYAGPSGQVSQRVMSLAQNGAPIRTATETFTYDDLGAMAGTAYPTCTGCGGAAWDSVNQTYTNGRVVGVSAMKSSGGPAIAFASGITYWPNGMMNVLTHGNSVTDAIGADTGSMARPGSITFSGWSACVGADIQGDSGDQTISSGGTTPLTVFTNGTASAPVFYQWYNGTTEISQATGQTYIAGPLTSTTTFSVVVSNACGRKRSRTITVTVCSKPSNVQITPGSTTIASGQTLVLSASATGSGITYQWYQGGTQVATGATFTTPALTATTSYFVRAVNNCGPADSATVTYTVPLAKPGAFIAMRSGTSAVVISWAASPGAHHYQLERRSGGQPYSVIATVAASPVTDALSIAANTTYVYRLQAFDAAGGSASPYSDPDLTTTKTFSTIVAGATIISYADVNDLLLALNMVRAANGSPPLGWASVSPGVPAPAVGELIRGAYISGLRTAMNQALSNLGITSGAYTDPSLADVPVKALHIEQLRGRTQ
jgi:YD repeat-containing protein